MGLQGYSTPTENTVIFSTLYPEFLRLVLDVDHAISSTIVALRGCYNGLEEDSYALPQSVFDHLMHRWRMLVRDQDSVLVLGTPQGMNWRPATLRFFGNPWEMSQDVGVFHSVTEKEALAHDNWTHNPVTGDWWICSIDPPDCLETEKERALQAKADAYDKIIAVLSDNYNEPIVSGAIANPQAIADAIASVIQDRYDAGFRSGYDQRIVDASFARHKRVQQQVDAAAASQPFNLRALANIWAPASQQRR